MGGAGKGWQVPAGFPSLKGHPSEGTLGICERLRAHTQQEEILTLWGGT